MARFSILVLTAVLALVGCASKNKTFEIDDYFLRSQFTYWEAQERYKFKYNKDQNILFLKTKIQADGNPYHLVVADRAWSASNNCGYRNPEDKALKFNTWLLLECNYDYERNSATPIQTPIEFTPKLTGEYLFEVTLLNGKPDQLRVNKIKTASKTNRNY